MFRLCAFSGKLDTFLNLVKEATPRAGFGGRVGVEALKFKDSPLLGTALPFHLDL